MARTAPRIRERSANPVRPPWTYRCRLLGRDVMIDVDAFNVREAAELAAGHWGVDRDDVDVEGQRRRWLRWVGISTHDATDHVAMDRNWWLWSKLSIALALGVAIAWPIGKGIGGAVREHRELSLEIQRAELGRLQVENAAATEQVATDDGRLELVSLPIRPDRPEGGSARDRYPGGPRPACGAWSPQAIEPGPRSGSAHERRNPASPARTRTQAMRAKRPNRNQRSRERPGLRRVWPSRALRGASNEPDLFRLDDASDRRG